LAEYRNPQNEPGADSRFLLLFLVAFAIMIALQPLYKKYLPTPPAPQQLAKTQPQTSPATTQSIPTPAKHSTPVSTVTKQASAETETIIENDLYRITFSNRGARVKSWILKKFDNDAENGPLDLVNHTAADQFGYPLSLWTYDESLRGKLNSELYVPSRIGFADGLGELGAAKITVNSPNGGPIPAGQTIHAPSTITFEYADQDLSVRKQFSFDSTYIVKIESSVVYKGAEVAAFPAWPGGFGDQTSPVFYASAILGYQFNKDIQRVPVRCGFSLFSKCRQVIGGDTIPGPFHWAGPADQYFAAVFIPDDPSATSMVTLNSPLEIPKDPQKPDSKEMVKVDVIGAAVGNPHGPTSERIFAGPKDLQVLQKIQVPGIGSDNDLNGLVDFGWWGIIAKPLFIWLKWTYNHVVPNWGWAIIVQTIILSLALMPLRITQMKSMLKMQRVAPQIKSIQEKYKKYSLRDPRKAAMNEEIAALYKKEGVNPAGGCLPMLIQFPFLIAYYRMLGTAIDLRHAHFLWIHDLSAAEPLPYILPILMVLSSLINQRMTPQAGMDPAQQRMMNVMMPLMMGFIFFRLQAGLNLYYAMSNLIMIGQQAVMNRTHLGREMRAIMAKRARKKDK
jgi:YidC/Oxa1 family membrane protein insertase